VNTTYKSSSTIVLGQPFFKAFNPVFDLDFRKIGLIGQVAPAPRMLSMGKKVMVITIILIFWVLIGILYWPVYLYTLSLVKASEEYEDIERQMNNFLKEKE